MTEPTTLRRRWFGVALLLEALTGVAIVGFAIAHGRFDLAGGLSTLTVSALAATKGVQNGKDIHAVKVEINSRLSELIAAVRVAAHAEGHAAGMTAGKEEASREAARMAGVAAAATATAITAGVYPVLPELIAIVPKGPEEVS